MEFVLNHPQKLIDFGYRAVHETTMKAKLIIAAFYSEPAREPALPDLEADVAEPVTLLA